MSTAQRRLAVRFDEAVWREAVRGFSGGPLEIAASARSTVERRGVALADVLPCEAHGPDETALAGCAKLYLPVGDAPPSERPLAFVLQLAREMDSTLVWVFVAFGYRHPRAGVPAPTNERIASCTGVSPNAADRGLRCRRRRPSAGVVRTRRAEFGHFTEVRNKVRQLKAATAAEQATHAATLASYNAVVRP